MKARYCVNARRPLSSDIGVIGDDATNGEEIVARMLAISSDRRLKSGSYKQRENTTAYN